MDIGGEDITINTSLLPQQQQDVILAHLEAIWPGGQVEHVDEDDPARLECFVYQDRQARNDWSYQGRSEANCQQMIGVICEPGFLSVTHERDDLDAERIREWVEEAEEATV